MKNIPLVVLFLFGSLMVKGQNSEIPSSVKNVESKVDSVLSLMTLEEKVGQLVQYNGSWDLSGPASEMNNKEKEENIKNGRVGSMLNVLSAEATAEAQRLVMENSRLKIPMMFGYDVIHGYKTMFPVLLGETASWDLEAMEKSARIAALESVADGINWTFSPMIDVSRDARWGRIMEGSGEDTYLTAQVAVANIKGYQGNDLADEKTIDATAKHFAGYGFAEAGRDYNTVHIGENELHNTILPPFEAAAKAGVATVMNAFNDLDGTPATGHKVLQRDILKGKWDWDGFVVSDWGSIPEMIEHGFAKDKKQAAQIALNAGSDMDMEGGAYESSLEELVEEGKVSMKHIDDAVRRVLRVKFKMGLFDDPYRYSNTDLQKEVPYEEHRATARDIAKKSIVLLKNEKELLPLKSSVKNIAVIGPLADDKDSPIGNWRAQGEANSAVSMLEGIKNAAGKNVKISYAKGADLGIGERSFLMPLEINETDRSGFKKAIKTAEEAELVVMALGEDAFQSGEGRSQVNIGLAGLQQEFREEINKVNQNIVLVRINGRLLVISCTSENIQDITLAWQLGSESGNAIADVLFGKYNPSGKLPVSFPRAVGQEPLYYNQKNTGRPSSEEHVTYSAYTDEKKDALYPFGFGLSYTDFEYGDLSLSSEEMEAGGSIQASVELTNNGDVEGKEIVQLYIRDLVASTTRPAKDHKLHYVNLTEYVAETEQIMELAKNANTGFILQSGLAPGYINILALGLFRDFCNDFVVDKVDKLEFKVGALTKNAVSPHYYGFTWSPVGVATEYLNKALVLRDYKKASLPPLSERKRIIIDGIAYEEDLTSGGAADLPDALAGKVSSLDYKTLRHPGHYSWVETQLEKTGKGPKAVKELQDIMQAVIPNIEDDQIILYAAVEGKNSLGILQRREISKRILPLKVGKHTIRAIQTTTAAGLLQCAQIILESNKKGVILQSTINPEEFLNGDYIVPVYGEK